MKIYIFKKNGDINKNKSNQLDIISYFIFLTYLGYITIVYLVYKYFYQHIVQRNNRKKKLNIFGLIGKISTYQFIKDSEGRQNGWGKRKF